jgi:protein-S-isoprenylcysteine O-methyltransferase Ste14
MTKKPSLAPKNTPPSLDQFVKRINRWSRAARIGTASFVSTILTLLVGYLLFGLLIDDPYSDSITLFYLLVSGVGIALYFLGWYWLGAFETNAEQPWVASRASAYYVLAGLLALVMVILAIIGGLIAAYLL